MSLYKQFKTDERLEEEGVEFQYGELFRVRLARLGNPKFMALRDKLLKPYRKVPENLRPAKEMEAITAKCFATAVVIPGSWQTKVRADLEVDPACGQPAEDGWVRGIEVYDTEAKKSVVKPATPDNICAVFKELPSLFVDLFHESSNRENYRLQDLENDAKN
jgi:hypothetical protein